MFNNNKIRPKSTFRLVKAQKIFLSMNQTTCFNDLNILNLTMQVWFFKNFFDVMFDYAYWKLYKIFNVNQT